MHLSTLSALAVIGSLSLLVTSAPLLAPRTCVLPTTIPRDVYSFSLRVDGSAEGAPELYIAWSTPETPESPGKFVLSTTAMTHPLLNFYNGNDGGDLCNEGDLCSDLDPISGPNEFQGFSFNGGDQNHTPAFQVAAVCDLEGEGVYVLQPRSGSGRFFRLWMCSPFFCIFFLGSESVLSRVPTKR